MGVKPGAILLFTIAFMAVGTLALRADSVGFDDGRAISGAKVEALRVLPSGALLYVQPQRGDTSYPVMFEDVTAISLRDSPEGEGRLAEIRLRDGEVRSQARVAGFDFDGDSVAVLLAGEEVDGERSVERLELDSIESIEFAPPPLADEDSAIGSDHTPTPTPVRTPVTPVPYDEYESPGFSLFVPNPALLTGEELDEGQRQRTDGSLDWGTLAPGSGEGFRMPEIPGWPRFLTANIVVPMINVGINLLGLIAFFIVGTLVGAGFLNYSARSESIGDFPLWKAFATASALTFFPPVLFLLCARFIPFLGCVVGVVAFYFVTRAIIMGAMEILEDKASNVVFMHLLLQLLTVMFVVLGLSWLLEVLF